MNPKKIGAALLALLVMLGLVTLTACSTQAGGDLGAPQHLARTCPHTKIVEYVGDDLSGSGSGSTITSGRAAAMKTIATYVAACNGHLHVDAFTGSAAASRVVFDGDLKPSGATEIARLRRVNALVATTMDTIQSGLAAATKSLSPNGSDIISQFGMASQFYAQLTGLVEPHVDLLTDGVQTVGVVLNTKDLTPATASNLAATSTAAPLPARAVVRISGLGKTAGPPPPTSYIDSLRTFYQILCDEPAAHRRADHRADRDAGYLQDRVQLAHPADPVQPCAGPNALPVGNHSNGMLILSGSTLPALGTPRPASPYRQARPPRCSQSASCRPCCWSSSGPSATF